MIFAFWPPLNIGHTIYQLIKNANIKKGLPEGRPMLAWSRRNSIDDLENEDSSERTHETVEKCDYPGENIIPYHPLNESLCTRKKTEKQNHQCSQKHLAPKHHSGSSLRHIKATYAAVQAGNKAIKLALANRLSPTATTHTLCVSSSQHRNSSNIYI
jgi:hypothetical protein